VPKYHAGGGRETIIMIISDGLIANRINVYVFY
jgi:hypothetical protein